jgi:hypothetical protein
LKLALVAAEGQAAIRHHQQVAGVLDRARRSVVTKSVVRAGGGIVWRRGRGGGVEIVLVHRSGYDDWRFPRASCRRARPRPRRPCARSRRRPGYGAGWAARSGPAPTVTPKRRPKTVRYWEMTPTAGTRRAATEIDDARWVPLGEAPGLLTHDHDRRLLEGWQPAG